MENIEEILDIIKVYLPKYLTPEEQEKLFSEIKNSFPLSEDPNKIYRKLHDTSTLYQGDGVVDIPFPILNVEKQNFALKFYEGVLLSNTCDLSNNENRLDLINPVFAVIISLKDYIQELKNKGIGSDRIKTFESDLRGNRVTNLFYLPANDDIEESFIRFDFDVSLPHSFIHSGKYNFEYYHDGDRLFTFSNYGFYLFLFKLSIHFSRFREGVFRE